jgi:DNA-binding MarR family transcriptional regulator
MPAALEGRCLVKEEEHFLKNPKLIIQDKRITPTERNYLSLIWQLHSAKGCFASNRYFADYFGVGRSTATEILSSLKKKGLIRSEEEKIGKKTVRRRLTIIDEKVLAAFQESKTNGLDSRPSKKESKVGFTDHERSETQNGMVGNSDRKWSETPTGDGRKLRNHTIDNTIEKTNKGPSSSSDLKKIFSEAYCLYEGTKRALNTEFFEFKNIPDWAEVLQHLKEAVEKQNKSRRLLKAKNRFVPELKHFKNWLRDRDWELTTEIDRQEEAKAKKETETAERRMRELLEEYGPFVREADPEVLRLRMKTSPRMYEVVKVLRPEVLAGGKEAV